MFGTVNSSESCNIAIKELIEPVFVAGYAGMAQRTSEI